MGYEKFTWVIKYFTYWPLVPRSEIFTIGGCKWYLMAYPKGKGANTGTHMSLFLVLTDFNILPSGQKLVKTHIKIRLSVVNQLFDQLSKQRVRELWLDRKFPVGGFKKMVRLTKLNAKEGGFLVNNVVKIIAEVDVLQVIGNLDVSKESQEVTQPLKRTKLNDDCALVKESIDVNGFQVLPSQAEVVKLIFERHPDLALEFRAKNQPLRTSCLNVLVNLIETLCLSLQDLSIDDLGQSDQALTYLKYSGFKVHWLELKLEEVKKKKMEEQISKSRMHELEEDLKVFKQKCSDIEALLEKEKEELKDLKQKCSDIEALLEKEKTKVLAASRASPLTLDDVV